jgi:hypothetical protein
MVEVRTSSPRGGDARARRDADVEKTSLFGTACTPWLRRRARATGAARRAARGAGAAGRVDALVRRRSRTCSWTSSSAPGERGAHEEGAGRRRKELHQIGRDRRTLLILLFVPAFFLLLYGYALNFDIRHVRLAVQDREHTPRAARSSRPSSTRATSTSWPSAGSMAEIERLMDRDDVRAVLVIPEGLSRPALGPRGPVQVLINGDNANTATTVFGYAQAIVRGVSADPVAARGAGPAAAPPISVEPRIWYNPELRSALFLVPGLIAFIVMLTAVVSTALSIVREKERGTWEQVRMAPISTVSYVVGKTIPYFVISLASAVLIILAAMVLFDLPMRGSWLCCCSPCRSSSSGARHGAARLDDRRLAAAGLPDRAARLAAADDDAVGVRLPDREHAGGRSR